MPNEILNELQSTTAEFIEMLSSVNNEQFNAVPFEIACISFAGT